MNKTVCDEKNYLYRFHEVISWIEDYADTIPMIPITKFFLKANENFRILNSHGSRANC